jgi:hypothetical protein
MSSADLPVVPISIGSPRLASVGDIVTDQRSPPAPRSRATACTDVSWAESPYATQTFVVVSLLSAYPASRAGPEDASNATDGAA